MKTIDELTKEYITAGEILFKAEADLEESHKKVLASLPERATYRKAELALIDAVHTKEVTPPNKER